jgi:hypothetical protein
LETQSRRPPKIRQRGDMREREREREWRRVEEAHLQVEKL